MLAGDELTRNWLADAIRGAADSVVEKHLSRLTQEAQITSKIADRIEERLTGMRINGYQVSVIATDMPERGRGSLESLSGVDLYIGIRVRRVDLGIETSKGLIVQGKLDSPPSSKDQERLLDQCHKMVARSSKGAYVWIYGSDGVRSIPASEILEYPTIPPQALSSRNVGQQFRDVLDCIAGDKNLVNSSIFDSSDELNIMMREIGAQEAVAINLEPKLTEL